MQGRVLCCFQHKHLSFHGDFATRFPHTRCHPPDFDSKEAQEPVSPAIDSNEITTEKGLEMLQNETNIERTVTENLYRQKPDTYSRTPRLKT